MADVPQAITVNGDTYTVPGADTIEPLAASVSYDGSGAGGDFMPCLSIYSQDGHLISRTFPAASVAAGSSAEVSFIPFVPPASGSASAGGIQFEVDNADTWLMVETDGFITEQFSQPAAITFGEDPTSFSQAFNVGWGMMLTCRPDQGGSFGVLTIENAPNVNREGVGQDVIIDTSGNGQAIGYRADVNSADGPALGIGVGVGTTGAGGATGGTFSGAINSGAAVTDAFGVIGAGHNAGSGASVGIQGRVANVGSGAKIPIRALDHAGTSIFEVHDSGQVLLLSLPTSAAGLPSGALWNNLGVVNIV